MENETGVKADIYECTYCGLTMEALGNGMAGTGCADPERQPGDWHIYCNWEPRRNNGGKVDSTR